MKPLSIRLQLSLMVSFLTLAIITALSIVAYIEFEESLLDNIDATLRAMGEGIRVELVEENEENHEAEFRAITGHDSSEYYSQCRVWVDGSEKDMFVSNLSGDPPAQGLLHPPAEEQPDEGDFSLFNIAGDAGSGTEHMLRAMWMRHVSPQGIVNILVARSSPHTSVSFSLF